MIYKVKKCLSKIYFMIYVDFNKYKKNKIIFLFNNILYTFNEFPYQDKILKLIERQRIIKKY